MRGSGAELHLMRLVSWNIRSLRDGSMRVSRTLRELEPDVVLLQEAPRLVLWRLSRHLLAARSGLRLVTPDKAAGNAVLARTAAVSSYAHTFDKLPGLHRRGTVGAVVQLAGRPLAVVGSHLDLDAAARLVTARSVRALAPDLPLVLGADVNEGPGGPAWLVLVDGLVDTGSSPTFPARAPTRRLDLLAASPALRCELQVPATVASDHRPLVADLSWAD